MNRATQNHNQMIINNESLLEEQRQQQSNQGTQQVPQQAPQYPPLYPAQHPPQYQYPAQYQQPQQPIYAPAEYAQVDPDLLFVRRGNEYNSGQNKRFGLFITLMQVAQMVLNYAFINFVDDAAIGYFNFFYKMSTFSVSVNLMIIIISVAMHKYLSDGIQIFLFIIYLLLSCDAQIWYFYVFDSHAYKINIFLFDLSLSVMALPLLNSFTNEQKPNPLVISIFTSLYMSCMIYIINGKYSGLEDYIIPIFICVLQSYSFTFVLQKVYNGENKIIKQDKMLLGYLQFKVFFYFPFILCI